MRAEAKLAVIAGLAIAGITTVSAAQAQSVSHAASADASWSSSDQVRALVGEMLSDAETRSSLLEGGPDAGYDGKFFIKSADGAFRLNIGGQLQFRYTANFRNPDQVVNDTDFENGFTEPRTRIFFAGNVQESGLFFRVMIDFQTSGGNGFLQDAFSGYDFGNGWQIRAGQGITAFMREWYMGDFKLFSVERSLQSLMFGQFRSQFAEAKYQNDDVRIIGTFSNGFRSANTDFVNAPAAWALGGRAEWKFAGDWKQVTDEYMSPIGSDFAGALSGAIHFEQGPDDDTGPAQDLFAWTADLLIKGSGWNAMLAGVGYHMTDEAGVSGADYDDYGFLAQFGILVTEKLELVTRYDVIIPDHDRAANDPFNTIMLGFNYYFHGQAARFSFAGYWFLDDTTGTMAGNFADTGARNPTSPLYGSLPSAEDNQVTLMAQFQLLF